MKNLTAILNVCLIMVCLLALSACTGASLGLDWLDKVLPEQGDQQDFLQTNYRAADALAEQVHGEISAHVPIVPIPLKAVQGASLPISEEATFPALVMQQVSSRLVQRGYNVTSRPDAKASHGNIQRAVLLGDYLISSRDIILHLEIQNEKTGQILAAHDYTMPLTMEVRRHLQAPEKNEFTFMPPEQQKTLSNQAGAAPSTQQPVPVREETPAGTPSKPKPLQGKSVGTPLTPVPLQ